MSRRLVARIEVCTDGCFCNQTVLEEWVGNAPVERLHEGLFLSDPSPAEMELLIEDLREIAYKHRLVESDDDPLVYERPI